MKHPKSALLVIVLMAMVQEQYFTLSRKSAKISPQDKVIVGALTLVLMLSNDTAFRSERS